MSGLMKCEKHGQVFTGETEVCDRCLRSENATLKEKLGKAVCFLRMIKDQEFICNCQGEFNPGCECHVKFAEGCIKELEAK